MYVWDYYTEQSTFSDPGRYAQVFDQLPVDVPSLVRLIQGLLIPPYDYVLRLHDLTYEDIVDAAFGFRTITELIENVLAICDVPLADTREPQERLGVNCRNFAVLLVSLLRHHGVPARERIGFELYLGGKISYEHRIAEYWHAQQNRWVRADAYVDPRLRESRCIDFDTLDIRLPVAFYSAGEVWLGARQQRLDPDQFGDSATDIGLPPIRYALLHDFEALNKFEVLGNDAWGALIDKPEEKLTDDELQFLDRVAALTLDPDSRLQELTALHRESTYGRQV